jgi:hypothetical protein
VTAPKGSYERRTAAPKPSREYLIESIEHLERMLAKAEAERDADRADADALAELVRLCSYSGDLPLVMRGKLNEALTAYRARRENGGAL